MQDNQSAKSAQSAKSTQNTQKYFEIDLGHKKVNARKWKAKDRKLFKDAIQKEKDIDESLTKYLVMNCLEDNNVDLSDEEIQYIILQIRKHSISDSFKFEWTCDCGYKNSEIIKIDDIQKTHFKEYTSSGCVEFQDVKNAKMYNSDKNRDEISELAYRTKSINSDMSMSFSEVKDYFEDMDIDELDKILDDLYSMMFTVSSKKKLTCKECSKKQEFEFDEIPSFFPESWYR